MKEGMKKGEREEGRKERKEKETRMSCSSRCPTPGAPGCTRDLITVLVLRKIYPVCEAPFLGSAGVLSL